MAYRTLNDAAHLHPGLAKGKTEIWYMRKESFRDFIMGPKWVEKQGLMPTTDTLEKTHILLGSVKERDMEQIFHWMQGEMWSPEGEARGLIQNKRLSHTSMSMGDIVKIGDTMHMVDMVGFKKISESVSEDSDWRWMGEQEWAWNEAVDEQTQLLGWASSKYLSPHLIPPMPYPPRKQAQWTWNEAVDEQWRPTDFRQLFPTTPPDLGDTRPLDSLRRFRNRKPRKPQHPVLSTHIFNWGESIEESQQIAKTMLQQMGGQKRLAMMTGAKNFVWDGKTKTLSFKVGRNSKGVNHVSITLRNDLYDLKFGAVRKHELKVKAEERGVYADMLGPMFEKHTGMYLKLAPGDGQVFGEAALPEWGF
jgi:hypothetical protein